VERSLAPDSQILFGVFVLLLFSPLAFGAVEPWAIFLLEAGSALLLCWWIYQQARTGTIQIRGNPLFAPMIAFAALVLLQVVFRISAYAHDTISTAVLYLAYAMLAFLVSQTLHRSAQAKTIGCVISAYGFLLASFALLQGLSGTTRLYWIRTPRMGGWIYGPYVNHNHYAGMMELLLPFPLVICFARFGERWLRMAAVATAALIAGTIFLSGSRGGMLACAIQLCVLASFLLRAQRTPRSAVTIGAFLVITVGLLVWIGGGQLADRLGSIHTEARSELSGGARWTLNKDSLHMATRKPILGWGLGTFPVVYPEFRSFYTNFFVNEAHDDYVQFLVETGAIGFAILLWFVWGMYRNALKKLENWTTDINGSIAMTCMLGCTGILVHSFLDFNLQIPANAAWFYVLAIVAASPHAVEVRQRVRRLRRSHVDASVTETAPEGT
jgi:O-antigen ligase